MLETDKAYAAGLFDGEGCVFYQGRYNLQVTVAQVDRTPLDWLEILFGGYVRFTRGQKQYNGCHYWHGNSQIGASFLEAILPYLLVKYKEAEGVLKQWNSRHSSSFS